MVSAKRASVSNDEQRVFLPSCLVEVGNFLPNGSKFFDDAELSRLVLSPTVAAFCRFLQGRAATVRRWVAMGGLYRHYSVMQAD